jgi:SWIM/SEC-C metal-binding protein
VHNLYYKGRIHTRENHVKTGFKNERIAKLGTEKKPLSLVVGSEVRKKEIEAIVADNEFYADITIDSAVDEDITELDAVLNTPKTTMFEKKPNRNDPCLCGSGKKYKKCCG